MLAIDTETTGLDLFHGARPFLVTTYSINKGRDGQCVYWEVPVDPLARVPHWVVPDLKRIQAEIAEADALIGQNIKYDVKALTLLMADHGLELVWPWHKTYDTLIAAHLLATNIPHDLTSSAALYLGEDISQYEEKIKKAATSARIRARNRYPYWNIAKKDNPQTPSAKSSKGKESKGSKNFNDSPWCYDMWLPRAIAAKEGYPSHHSWWTACSNYANCDSVTTYYLWLELERRIKSRGLWKVFVERMKLCKIAMDLEMPRWQGQVRGISIKGERLEEKVREYREESQRLEQVCMSIAASLDYELVLPKSGKNKSLVEFCFGPLELPLMPRHRICKDGSPSLNKEALDYYEAILPDRGKQRLFIGSLRKKRKINVATNYLLGYKRFWQPAALPGYWALHCSANPTGTDTLRWSFSNPNTSNVSDQDDYSLRDVFGPLPGREWYSMDGQNLELRIPAYESGEVDVVYIFEHPNDPPYYGSYHLMVFDLLYPDLFKRYGKDCKTHYKRTYTRVKSGNFAVIYGCQEKKADLTYGVPGAFQMTRKRFPRIAALADKQRAYANKHGHVFTIPDREVDPDHGYPIMCSRSENGSILPTVPLNYHIQSTAMQWTNMAMVSCTEVIDGWQAEGFDLYINIQEHDKLVFDTIAIDEDNLWRIAKLKACMEQCGDRIGVPTPVDVSKHTDNWGGGESVNFYINHPPPHCGVKAHRNRTKPQCLLPV